MSRVWTQADETDAELIDRAEEAAEAEALSLALRSAKSKSNVALTQRDFFLKTKGGKPCRH